MAVTVLRIGSLRMCCKVVRTVGNVSFRMGRKRIVTLVNTGKTKGAAALRAVAKLLSPGGNSIVFRKASVAGVPTRGVISVKVTRIPRKQEIFTRLDICRGLGVNTCAEGSGGRVRRDLTGICGEFPHLRREEGRVTKALDNKRRRVLTVKHTLVSGPGVVLVSRPSVKLSPVFMGRVFSVVRTMDRDKAAMLLMRRGTGGTLSVTSHTCILRANGVAVSKGTGSLLRSRTIGGTCLKR